MKTKSKILIVDDDIRNIQVLATILKEEGYQIIIARDGQQAIKAAREVLPDIILLDIMMPVMDGYEACRKLKESPGTANIPVIFLSAKDQIEDVIQGFDLGAVDYVVKPPNKRELLSRVATHIELKQKTDMLRIESQELREKNRKIEANLKLARQIQRQVMPINPPRPEVAFYYNSTEEVGGDFFDFFPLDENRLGIFISDVSGHGVAAAFVTLLIKKTLYYEKDALDEPGTLLTNLNKSLFNQGSFTFVTAFYGVVDFQKKEMTFSSAGHCPPYMISGNDIVKIQSQKKSLPIGVLSNEYLGEINKGYTSEWVSLSGGSRLVVFTDGLSEAVNKKDSNRPADSLDFESAQMEAILITCGKKSASEIVGKVIKGLSEYCETSENEDDVCLICVEI